MDARNPYQPPRASPVVEEQDDPNLGSLGARLFATLIDGTLLFFAYAIGALLTAAIAQWLSPAAETKLLMIVPFPLAVQIYQWWRMARRGETLGKWLLDLRVVRLDGRPVDFMSGVFLRSWVSLGVTNILNILTCGLLGSLALLIDALFVFRSDRRCLHDVIAGTKVVRVTTSKGRS